ncbi:hypothetical protein EVAR_67753_1 [Eumeta japonica]|uniref:Uncharacterized protein n=1 Tax=Eumeta variegata TaxID=151549 RepID=A0A4C1ZGP6_EUMVA|nr:hypothetical protein EVAR_67753_1 [Eumeta japonica]
MLKAHYASRVDGESLLRQATGCTGRYPRTTRTPLTRLDDCRDAVQSPSNGTLCGGGARARAAAGASPAPIRLCKQRLPAIASVRLNPTDPAAISRSAPRRAVNNANVSTCPQPSAGRAPAPPYRCLQCDTFQLRAPPREAVAAIRRRTRSGRFVSHYLLDFF